MKNTHHPIPRDEGPRESLVAEAVDEFRERCARGEQPDAAEHAARFPQVVDELRRLLPALAALDAAGLDSDDGTPTALGDFRIQREVGRGGMAVVYEAEQLSLARKVALKVLPFAAVMDPRQLQRFKNEAQAAAHLHHGHIVPVHSVGCERGVHYYAMQYIEGMSVAQMIEELGVVAGRDMPAESSSAAVEAVTRGKSTRSATYCRAVARLGIQAAEALDHAHQQGVVHRDIKPANLLVDAAGHLWITDFGLASFTTQPGLTMTGDLVGTVRYMSPEQALAKRVPIDHRTDIYSLGVTLYELLTLEVAFSGDDPHRVIQEIAFTEPKPARSLNPAVPNELETILLKAMAKDPAERFATAQELADDLARYLAHEPIRARRPTLAQRAGKWARRHAALVWGVAAVLALAVAGLVTGATLLWREQARTEQQRERAEVTRGLALDALDQVYFDQAESNLQLRAGLSHDLLERGLAFYDRFTAENRNDPDVRAQTGWALIRAGRIHRGLGREEEAVAAFEAAVAVLGEALRLQPDNTKARYNLGLALVDLGSGDEGVIAFRKAIRLDPDHARAHGYLGWALLESGQIDEAIVAYRDAIRLDPGNADARNDLGLCLGKKGQADEAIAEFRESIRVRPGDYRAYWNLALALREKGLLDEAIRAYRDVVRLKPDDAERHLALGLALWDSERCDEAIDAWRQAIRLNPEHAKAYFNLGLGLARKDLLDEAIYAFREATRLDPDHAKSYAVLGNTLVNVGRVDDGMVALREAIRLDPGLAEAHFYLGGALAKKGVLEKATVALREAIRLQPDHVGAHSILGSILVDTGRVDEGMVALRKAIRLEPDSAWAHSNLGSALGRLSSLDEAIAEYRKAIRLAPRHAPAHFGLGFALQSTGQFDKAIEALREAARLAPNVAAQNRLAWLLATCPDETLRNPEQAVALARKAVSLAPIDGNLRNTLGVAHYRAGHLDKALHALAQSMCLRNGGDAYDWLFIAMAKCRLGEREDARVQYERSLAWIADYAPDDPELKRFAAEAAELIGANKD
jgi:tetratricopeptide (TPR) repeat protein/tRNA A-37 threonylcarbamoyl transferase component Bud32